MPVQAHILPVIKTGAPEFPIIHSEARDANHVEIRIGGGTKACDVTRIGGDLWLVKGNLHLGLR